MFDYNISGIQQVGIGVADADKAFAWYGKHFGMDLPIFSDEAEAKLMIDYTGNEVHKRKAILAMNLQGGGGFEIWQFTSRKGQPRKQETKEGDLGITHIHIRTYDAEKALQYFKKLEDITLSEIKVNEMNRKWFELKDPFGNLFKLIEDDYCFMKTGALTGGAMGVTIGVSNIEKSREVYQKGMQYDTLAATGESGTFKNVWLKPSNNKVSAFSQLLGPTQLELVCDTAGGREQIFRDRFWGDLGFIHVCFDVQRMHQLREYAKTLNHPFTVDSENSFDMGEAAGQFAYIEDNDKTLIELVETHKVPIMKKLGWYINVKNKKVQKPLPKLIFKALSLNRVK
tara:strand:+ start:1522 stop:2544 length:1023 start_codon:yes stop_codon:yes gene_type:complete